MDKLVLIKLVNKKLTTRQIAESLKVSQTNVRYWLKKHEIKTFKSLSKKTIYRYCNVCNKEINCSRRKRCQSCTTRIRRYRTKQAAVKFLGGCCQSCGWNGDISAFDFHHIDSDQKDFQIGSANNKSWEIVKKELEKCRLLCSNCHRIEHNSERDPIFLEAVMNYKGYKKLWN
jgi:hypothetical protein